MPGEQRRDAGAISEIELVELEVGKLGEFLQARQLEGRVVIGVEIVETDHDATLAEQVARGVEADEAGRAGDENGLARHVVCSFAYCRAPLTIATGRRPPVSCRGRADP